MCCISNKSSRIFRIKFCKQVFPVCKHPKYLRFQKATDGKPKLDRGNWQLTFSDIEGKSRTYEAHFSCIKDLRVLWLDDKAFFKA